MDNNLKYPNKKARDLSETDIQKNEWYKELVDDCKTIIVERLYRSRQEIIECWHEVGERINTDPNYQKAAKGNLGLKKQIAADLGKSYQTLYFATKFYAQFPVLSNALETFKEGKALSWHQICNKYLYAGEDLDNIVGIPLPQGQYDIIYADPPWLYNFSETQSRAIDTKYQPLSLDEIKNIKVPSAENAVLFLWSTAPKIEEALEVMRFWGFIYKTHGVWDKQMIGMGYWFRGQHELLLVGVKGKVSPPAETLRVSSVYHEKRTEHSKKPDYYYNLIEKMFPSGKYLELFARQQKKGWTAWGNESQ